MNKGFSLLEFLIATSFFLTMIFTAYKTLATERDLFVEMTARTRPEEESNYRLLVIKAFFQNASASFKRDALLAEAPFFFPDLQFGQLPNPVEFSIARPISDPVPFARDLNLYRVPATLLFTPGTLLLLAGVNPANAFDWNYARVVSSQIIGTEQKLQLQFLLARSQLDSGKLVAVDVHGFSLRNRTLYWISPAGQPAPYFGKLDDFNYQWNNTQLKMSWRKGMITSTFVVTP
jgi:hypothetical protein